jgi:hypothetical protein
MNFGSKPKTPVKTSKTTKAAQTTKAPKAPKVKRIKTDELKKLIQKLSRQINSCEYCCTCGYLFTELDLKKGICHGGHFMPGKKTSTQYYILNIHPQCAKCNIFNEGEQAKYFMFMEKTYGREFTEWVIKVSDEKYKFTTAELKDLWDYCVLALKENHTKEQVTEFFHNTDWYNWAVKI